MVLEQDSSVEILLVEDNRDIAENIIEFLEKRSFSVDYAASGLPALALLKQYRYRLLILDVMLPDMDGFHLAMKIRHALKIDTPILFLTARDTLDDKLQGFAVGGDDYLTKPFALEELAARVNAFSKRAAGKVVDAIELGGWRIENGNYRAFYANTPVKLTRIGFKLLRTLVANQPNVVLRSEMERVIWGDDPPDSDALRSHVFALRKAISKVTSDTRIETVHGIGFRLIMANQEAQ